MALSVMRGLALALVLACATAAASADDVTPPARALLWQVSSKTTTLFLFGTIHVGRSEFYPLPQSVERALAKSKSLVVEANISQSARETTAAKAGFYTPPDSVEKHIPADLLEQVKALLPKYGMTVAGASTMRPWLLGITLTLRELGKYGFDSYLAVDLYLMDQASREGKPIVALESADAQAAMFQAFSAEEELAVLQGSVKQIRDGRTSQIILDVVNAWGVGNATRCERAFAASYADLPLAARINAKLIDERNLAFLKQIEAFLKDGEPRFVAVGTAHLLGKNGIVQSLKRRGYKVRQL
jgi:uncharacterized protein